ncbi:MAG: hypothetical protein OET44_04535 [Gammaproteobacteria bacterium]|nr:hypothetical protein [Gammaproteobacteria bacterium]
MRGRSQRGMSVLLVIFLLGAVSLMGSVIATLAATQHFSVAFSGRSAQAYFAARAGMQYAAARVSAGAGCAGITPTLTIDNFSVAITCNVSGTFNEGEATVYSIYDLATTASGGSFAAPDVANRRLQATLKFP